MTLEEKYKILLRCMRDLLLELDCYKLTARLQKKVDEVSKKVGEL